MELHAHPRKLSRYSIVIGYTRFLCPRGAAILDLGCGEGILQQYLGPDSYAQYVGVDISQAAIDAARARSDHKTRFVCSDVTAFEPDTRFDAIVFHEVLYYLPDPVPVMRRYEQYLKPGGIIIVSMFLNDETHKNWTTLERAYQFFDETRTGNAKSRFSVSCRVARPSASVTPVHVPDPDPDPDPDPRLEPLASKRDTITP